MNDKRDTTALIITICAVITAMPRWIGALLAAEGFVIPEGWLWWWIVASAIFNAAMAITEGFAFAYVFNAWRTQKDKSADRLLWFAAASGITFVIVLAPFIAAQVRSRTLTAMLSHDWALWLWSAAVAASTIVIVASVGYAQKRTSGAQAIKPAQAKADAVASRQESESVSEVMPQEQSHTEAQAAQGIAVSVYQCDQCGATAGKNGKLFTTNEALSAHKRFCTAALVPTNGSGSEAR